MAAAPTTPSVTGAATPVARATEFLLDQEQMQRRLRIHGWVRFGLSIMVLLAAGFGRLVVGIDLDLTAFALLAVAIAAYNVVLLLLLRHACAREKPNRVRCTSIVAHVATLMDYMALTVALYYVGGGRSPFSGVYLVHVILTCVLLGPRSAIFQSVFAYLLYAGLVLGELFDALAPRLPEGAVAVGLGEMTPTFALTLLVVQAVLFALVTTLLSSLTHLLQTNRQLLAKAYDDNRKLANLRRDLLRIILHDLRSPLAAATQHLRNLSLDPLTERQERWIERSIERLNGQLQFLRDFQALALVENADFEQQAEPVDVAAMVREVVDEAQEQAQSKDQTLALDGIADDLPVRAVPRLLREAVYNLVHNAIKYTPTQGRIDVAAAALDGDVRVSVQDTGPGIAPEQHERIFQDFLSADGRRARDPSGVESSGLGLPIVRNVAQMHGGRVELDSAPGEGSTFTLVVPSAAAEVQG
jgi:signal transduction histidine kinase